MICSRRSENTEAGISGLRRGLTHHCEKENDGTLSKTDRYGVGEAVSPNTDSLLFLTGTYTRKT